MTRPIYLILFALLLSYSGSFCQNVSISAEADVVQAVYAKKKLQIALTDKGYLMGNKENNYKIILNLDSSLEPEGYQIRKDGSELTIAGGDERGLIYGAFAIREDILNGVKLNEIGPSEEHLTCPI